MKVSTLLSIALIGVMSWSCKKDDNLNAAGGDTAPVLSSVLPDRALSGGAVQIIGRNIANDGTTLSIAGAGLPFTVRYAAGSDANASDTLDVTLPTLAPGAYDVVVKSDRGNEALANALEVFAEREATFLRSRHLGDISKEQVLVALTPFAIILPEISNFISGVQHGISLHEVIFSTSHKGVSIEASALVSLPQGEGTWDIIALNHGTITRNIAAPTPAIMDVIANDNLQAPTNIIGISGGALPLLFSYYAAQGFVVLQPDYVGFGASRDQTHPYYIAENAAQNSINALSACYGFSDQAAVSGGLSGDVFLAGYSEGGFVTLSTLRALELRPVEGLAVHTTLAGAGAYHTNNMLKIVLAKKTFPVPGFLAGVVHAFIDVAGVNIAYTDVFNAPYAGRVPTLFDKQKTIDEVSAELTTTVSDLFTEAFIGGSYTANASFTSALSKNELYGSGSGWRPRTPLRLYHNRADELIPSSDTDNAHAYFAAEAVTLFGNKYRPNVVRVDLNVNSAISSQHAGGALDFHIKIIAAIAAAKNPQPNP